MPRHKTLPYPIRAAGCVVFLVSADKKIQYLLLHRQGLNHWIPPKGHHRPQYCPNETDMDIAMREMGQCGFTADDLIVYEDAKDLSSWPVHGGKNNKVITYWLAQLVNKNAEFQLPRTYDKYRWVSLQEAIALIDDKYKETLDMMNKFDAYINEKILV